MSLLKAPDIDYGSDKSGLVWGYLFTPGESAQPVDCAQALEWLAQPRASDGGFVWLHFSLSNAAAEPFLRRSLKLPETFHEGLHESVGSTRLELSDGQLVAIMHDALFNQSFEAANVSTVSLALEPRLVVSARLRPLRSLDQLRAAVKSGESLRSSAELLAELLRNQAAVLADIVRQTTMHVDGMEDSLLADHVSVTRTQMSALRRALVRLQRLLAPEPAALFRLLSRPPAWLSEQDVTDLRQAAEELNIAVTDSGALAERLKLLQEELAAMVSEHTNRSLFLLTLVTVLALPINVVAGLLGMNVGGLPLNQHPQGFMMVVIGLTVVTVILAYIFLLRRRD